MFWGAVLCLCFKLPICLFGHSGDTSVIYEKAKVIYFIYMQPRKVKFIFVQINIKQVSYAACYIEDLTRMLMVN